MITLIFIRILIFILADRRVAELALNMIHESEIKNIKSFTA